MMKKYLGCLLFINLISFAQVPTNSLSAYYPFNGNTLDYVGTRHGVSAGTPQYGTDRFGHTNGCYDVIDNTNYINLPADYWIYGDYSVSAWVKVKQLMPYPRLYDFSNGYMVNNAAGEISHSGSGHTGPAMGYSASSSNQSSYFSYNTLSLNTWHHLVFISSGTQKMVYIDNVLDGTATGANIPENIYRTKNKIGGSNAPANDATKAFIDDFRLYDRAITPEEVDALYNEADIPTGVHEIETTIDCLSVFPNPATNDLSVGFVSGLAGKNKIVIYDSLGKPIYACDFDAIIGSNAINVNTHDFTSGFYYLSVSGVSGTRNIKFIKN